MKRYIPRQINIAYLRRISILAVSYFITAKIGLSLYAVNMFATLIWPPSGIALALLILWGYDIWPGILIAAFLVNFLTGASFFVAAGIAVGNTLEALVGTYLLRHFINLYRCFERLTDTLGFILLAGLGGTLVSATIGVSTLVIAGLIAPGTFLSTWFAWWIGDTLAILVITPFLLTWMAPTRKWNPDGLRIYEIVSFFSTLILLNVLIFWSPFFSFNDIPLLYLTSLPLLWGVLRLGSRGMTVSLFITAIIATTSTVFGHGPFVVMSSVSWGLLFCQIFVGIVSITFLVFLSIVKERNHSMEEIRNYVDKLRQSFREIKSSDKAKSDFLAMLAHELRNPLASVLSSLELMTIRSPSGEIANIIDTTQNHVKHMSRLLDDLLDISIISQEKLILQKEILDIREVITYSLEESTPLLKSKDHLISVSMPQEPLFVYGDSVRLSQVIINLFHNSSKYTDPHGSLNVSVVPQEDNVVISIIDNGIGIENDMLEKIFEPFIQVQNNAVRFGKGLGIGLSLSKKLVEAHEGTITVTSEGLGKGSQFSITLPLVKISLVDFNNIPEKENKIENISSPQNNRTDSKTKRKKGYRILVVDDNEAVADGLSKLLTYKGHETQVAYSGQSALDIFFDFNPQVVLLDIGLPDIDGYDVAQHIREKYNPLIVIVALTGYGQYEDKEKAQQAGFNYHLTKPVSIIDIEAVLAEMNMKK